VSVAEDFQLALVGVGNISAIYIKMLGEIPGVHLVGVSDALEGRAEEVAAAHEGLRALTVDEVAKTVAAMMRSADVTSFELAALFGV